MWGIRNQPRFTPEDFLRAAGRPLEHVADFEIEIGGTSGWRFDRQVILSDGPLADGRVVVVLYHDPIPWLDCNCDMGYTRLSAASWLIRRRALDSGSLYVAEDGFAADGEMRRAWQRWQETLKNMIADAASAGT